MAEMDTDGIENGATGAVGSLELGLAGGGSLRWAVAEVTALVEEARDRLDLSPIAAAALGRSLAGAALLLRMATKTPSRLVLEIRGDGPLGQVLAEADQEGNLRGMVGNPYVDLPATPAGKLDVGRAVGQGRLRVLREHGQGGEGGSYHSQVELVSGEIGEDVAHYLAQSEQIDSAVLLGVLTKPFGVAAAGGMIVEVLPGAREEVVERLKRNIAGVPGVSHLVEAGGSGCVVETLLAGLDREVRESRPLRYRCRCSRERLLRHLVLLSAEDRDHLREDDGHIAADCVFCGSQYRFTAEELA